MISKLYDVLVIGGGPAGLSAAVGLARQTHTALILDSGVYRNARSTHMHTVPGFDHRDPAEFRAKVRADLEARYWCVEYKGGVTVSQVRRLEGGNEGGLRQFEAVGEDGTVWKGRRLVLATGVKDLIDNEVEGFAECWGRGVFHCLFCHGYEERGADSVGVLATDTLSTPEMLTHVARMAKRLSRHVNIYTGGRPSLASLAAHVRSSGISIDDRPVASLALVDGGPRVRIAFGDGSEARTEGFVVSHPAAEQSAPFAAQLGLEMGAAGEIKAGAPWNETSVEGCYAAGDSATQMRSALQAVHMGGMAGAGVVMGLQKEMEARDEL